MTSYTWHSNILYMRTDAGILYIFPIISDLFLLSFSFPTPPFFPSISYRPLFLTVAFFFISCGAVLLERGESCGRKSIFGNLEPRKGIYWRQEFTSSCTLNLSQFALLNSDSVKSEHASGSPRLNPLVT